ncbi:MAG TPA: DinB family protein [Gemmataceae bacterium]|nr:DinB family protein [Gemmataceae bacterium]
MPTPAELTDAYLKGAADLRAAVTGMTREQLVARPVPGRWSTLELICHLADFEAVFAERMKRIIALGETPLLVAADEKLFLKHLKYHDRDAGEELALIDATRGQMARLIRTLTPEQLQLTGVHTAAGLITLEKVIQTAINHVQHHLSFVPEKKKALGIG